MKVQIEIRKELVQVEVTRDELCNGCYIYDEIISKGAKIECPTGDTFCQRGGKFLHWKLADNEKQELIA